ncbi:MAG: hypothetical protein Q9174_006175, partial [Haloplaca sp. 1 TL-2023]
MENNNNPKRSENILQIPQVDETYDQWASTYDTDGNFLQALDSLMMPQLLQGFVAALPSPSKPANLIDLGCGTGRNTRLLLSIPHASIWALDNSTAMLARAQSKAQEWTTPPTAASNTNLNFQRFDVNSDTDLSAFLNIVSPESQTGIISTLLLEHVTLTRFFTVCHALLQPGGILLVTNMHEDMGKSTQAGFWDRETGRKVQTISFIHSVDEVVEKAGEW